MVRSTRSSLDPLVVRLVLLDLLDLDVDALIFLFGFAEADLPLRPTRPRNLEPFGVVERGLETVLPPLARTDLDLFLDLPLFLSSFASILASSSFINASRAAAFSSFRFCLSVS